MTSASAHHQSYALHWRSTTSPTLSDGSMLCPQVLCGLPIDAVRALMLPVGRVQVPLGDLFEVSTTDGVEEVHLHAAPPLNRLGANMTGGTLVIEGDAGDDLGSSMSGGLIKVTGNVGHRAGGPDVASRRGMTGGEIVISGNTGDYAGFLMRRGLIAIAGTTGKSPGYRMLAGTIVLGSPCADQPGLEMRRGTIIAVSQVAAPVSFREVGIIAASAMPAVSLVVNRLRALEWPPLTNSDFDRTRMTSGAWRLWSGDGLSLNKGEVMQWQS